MDIIKKIFPVGFAVAGLILIIVLVNMTSMKENLFLFLMGIGLGLIGVTMAWFLAFNFGRKK